MRAAIEHKAVLHVLRPKHFAIGLRRRGGTGRNLIVRPANNAAPHVSALDQQRRDGVCRIP
jgi:hypothetical protein